MGIKAPYPHPPLPLPPLRLSMIESTPAVATCENSDHFQRPSPLNPKPLNIRGASDFTQKVLRLCLRGFPSYEAASGS